MLGTHRLQMSLDAVRRWLDQHPMHTIANFNPKQKCFRVTMRRSREDEETTTFAYTGITKFLQRYFGTRISGKRPRGLPAAPSHGVEGGTMFHTRCEIYMQMCQQDAQQARAFEQEHRRACKLFDHFARYVRDKRYVPLACEYTVCDPVLGFATAVDCIWADPANKRVVFVELKTGYDGVFVKSHGVVGEPLNIFKGISPKNRALAQVYLSSMQHVLSGAPAGWALEAQVWHVTAQKMMIYCLDPRCMTHAFAKDMHDKLRQCNQAYSTRSEHRHPLQKGNNRIKRK